MFSKLIEMVKGFDAHKLVIEKQNETLKEHSDDIRRLKVAYNSLNEKFKTHLQNFEDIKKLKVDYIRLLKETKSLPTMEHIKNEILNLSKYQLKEVIFDLENILAFLKGDRIEDLPAPVVVKPTPVVVKPAPKPNVEKEKVELPAPVVHTPAQTEKQENQPILKKENLDDLYLKMDVILNKILSKEEIEALNL